MMNRNLLPVFFVAGALLLGGPVSATTDTTDVASTATSLQTTDERPRPTAAGQPDFVKECRATDASTDKCKEARKEFDRRHSAHGHFRKAVAALEHRIAVLEIMEYRTEQRLMQPNLTANATEAGEARLERIENAQDDTIERLIALKERWRLAHDGPDDDYEDDFEDDDGGA